MTRRTIGLLVTLTLVFLVAPLAADEPSTAKLSRIGLLTFAASSRRGGNYLEPGASPHDC